MMRRNDNYLPVPGEDKNLDVDFNSTSKSKESIVRHYIPANIYYCWVMEGGVTQ